MSYADSRAFLEADAFEAGCLYFPWVTGSVLFSHPWHMYGKDRFECIF